MGLIDMIKEVFTSLGDMKKINSLLSTLEEDFTKLDGEGKLPAEVKTALEEVKNAQKNGTGENSQEAMDALKKFADVLEKHEAELPDDLHKKVEQFTSVTDEVEGIMEKVTKKD